MTSPKTKRKRVRKWTLKLYRAAGEFKDGERKMITYWNDTPKPFRNKKLAMRRKCANWKEPIRAFVGKEGVKQKIVELQLWPDDYSAE